MSVPHAFVKGTFRDATGTVRANGRITFLPLSTPYASDGDIFTSQAVFGQLDSNGYLSPFKLIKGFHRVVVSDTDAFFINVPDDSQEYFVDVLASSFNELPVDIKRVLSSTEIMSGTVDTTTIRRSRRGDPSQLPMRMCFFGESGDLPSDFDDLLYRYVKNFGVEHLVVLGNANPGGEFDSITKEPFDSAVGGLWHEWMYNASTDFTPKHPTSEHFWYAHGSEDWADGPSELNTWYFSYPNGTKNYYKASLNSGQSNSVALFVIDSNMSQPDGYASNSVQATWLRDQLAAATERWKLVVFRDTPRVSVSGKEAVWMEWPFESWGADAVVAAGAKICERIDLGGIPLFVSGAAGTTTLDTIGTPRSDSQFRYNSGRAVLMIDVTAYQLKCYFADLTSGVAMGVSFKEGQENQSVNLAVKFKPWSGLKAGHLEGFEPRFLEVDELAVARKLWGDAPNLQSILLPRTGSVLNLDTLPLAADVQEKPWLKYCILAIGDDPVRFYWWNKAKAGFLPFASDHWSSFSYYGGTVAKLADPTLTPSNGLTVATVVDHVDTSVQIFVSVNGGLFERLLTWPDQKQFVIPNLTPNNPVMVAVYARKTGYIDSEIVTGEFYMELDQGSLLV